jgi:chromosome partitioning protein
MRVVAIANQKGGCGKTTTAVNLSACLGARGRRVLLVDLDPQSHATVALRDPETLDGPGVAAVLARDVGPEAAIHPAAPGVDMLCSSPELEALESELVLNPGTGLVLRDSLGEIAGEYDLAVIDCPPNRGPLTRLALAASDYLLLPVETSYFALYGVGRMLRLVREEESRRGHDLPYGVVVTLFDRRTKHAREVLTQLRDHFGENLFNTVICVNVSLREAASHGRPITDYRPRSRGCHQHMDLSEELTGVLSKRVDRQAAMASGGERWTN